VERKRKKSDGLVNFKILVALTVFPFHSVRTLASSLKIPRSTTYDHFQRGNFPVKYLRWVSRTLDPYGKRVRVGMANSMLMTTAAVRHQSWPYFLTVDESWLFYSTDYEQMWLPQREKAPTRTKRIISTRKVMIILFWSPLGLPVIDALPAGEKFTARYFHNDILPQIAEPQSSDARQNRGPKFVVHMNNATPQRAKLTKSYFKTLQLREAGQSPHSPDLAPSDFYRFGEWKEQTAGSEFGSTEELLGTIRQLTNAISRAELESSFQEWERRLGEDIRIGGEYVS
jgi:hypothetical protein